MQVFLKKPSDGFMDDCTMKQSTELSLLHKTNNEMVSHRHTDKKWLLLKKRLLRTLSRGVKIVTLLFFIQKNLEMQLLSVFHSIPAELNIFTI